MAPALSVYFSLSCCNSVGIDLLNDPADAHPDGEIGEDLHDAALVCERRLLKHRQIFHHAVVDAMYSTIWLTK